MRCLKNIRIKKTFDDKLVIRNTANSVSIKIMILTFSLVAFGLLMIYSASNYTAIRNYGDAFYYVKKQLVAVFIGSALMIGIRNMPTKFLRKFRIVILVISFVLLGVIFIPGVGVENYGARRWINLGFMTMQPSEIAKFGYVIFTSSYIAENSLDKFRNIILVCGVGGLMCLLIMLEPNMSITMCLGSVMLIMLLLGGVNIKKFLLILLPVIILVPVLIVIEPYRLKRLMAFIDPWASPKAEGYQLIQSYYALGRGGLFGVGLFNSRQKYLFLPFAESDFIFSIIGEELGLIGCLFVILIFILLVYYGYLTATKAKTRFEALLAGGVTSVIAVQTALNIAVVTGCVPPTGLPLPFVSAGGSSLVSFMSAIGILLSINKHSDTFYLDSHTM